MPTFILSRHCNGVGYSAIIVAIVKMMSRLARILSFSFRTVEQDTFIRRLPSLQLTNDETAIQHIRHVYQHRVSLQRCREQEFIEECEEVADFVERVETFFLRRKKCTVAHLQCYYKLKEMRLTTAAFRYNTLRKYHEYLLDLSVEIRNEHLEKYLWFLFDEGRYQLEEFEDAASNHTLNLHEIYEYMNSLPSLPTWEPYLRVATMLKFLGHQVEPHRGLQLKKNIDQVEHRYTASEIGTSVGLQQRYYPFLAGLFTPEEMRRIRREQKYDEPLSALLLNEYFIKNTSRYDSYLQRVERVEVEKSYERLLDVTSWSDLIPLLDLLRMNHRLHGGNDDLENQFSELFFRLCEHTSIDLETIIGLLDRMHRDNSFMYFRRSPLISRTMDALQDIGIEEFSFLPADGFITLLQATKRMDIGQAAISGLQSFVCKKAEYKRAWLEGERERLQDRLREEKFQGKEELLKHLQQMGGR